MLIGDCRDIFVPWSHSYGNTCWNALTQKNGSRLLFEDRTPPHMLPEVRKAGNSLIALFVDFSGLRWQCLVGCRPLYDYKDFDNDDDGDDDEDWDDDEDNDGDDGDDDKNW